MIEYVEVELDEETYNLLADTARERGLTPDELAEHLLRIFVEDYEKSGDSD